MRAKLTQIVIKPGPEKFFSANGEGDKNAEKEMYRECHPKMLKHRDLKGKV
jgi:hypothetical protein